MQVNPSIANYRSGSEIYQKMLDFNQTYMALLDDLQKTFCGYPNHLMQAVGVMYDLKYKAVALMNIPSGDGETTVGPSFEYVKPSDRVS